MSRSSAGRDEGAAIGVPDVRGEVVTYPVTSATGVPVAERKFMDHCQGQMARVNVPRVVGIRDGIPRSLVRTILRQGHAGEARAPPAIHRTVP